MLAAEQAALSPNAERLAGTLELLTSFMTHAHVCIGQAININEPFKWQILLDEQHKGERCGLDWNKTMFLD